MEMGRDSRADFRSKPTSCAGARLRNYAAPRFRQELNIPYGTLSSVITISGGHFCSRSAHPDFDVRVKLESDQEMVAGKRVVVIDDSIVRGTTRAHAWSPARSRSDGKCTCVSCPPHRLHVTTDRFPDLKKLIANQMSMEDICNTLALDSLGYLDVEGMVRATGKPLNSFCLACFKWRLSPKPVDPAWINSSWKKREQACPKRWPTRKHHPTLFADLK